MCGSRNFPYQSRKVIRNSEGKGALNGQTFLGKSKRGRGFKQGMRVWLFLGELDIKMVQNKVIVLFGCRAVKKKYLLACMCHQRRVKIAVQL